MTVTVSISVKLVDKVGNILGALPYVNVEVWDLDLNMKLGDVNLDNAGRAFTHVEISHSPAQIAVKIPSVNIFSPPELVSDGDHPYFVADVTIPGEPSDAGNFFGKLVLILLGTGAVAWTLKK